MSDYPKVMTRAGAEISVGGAAEETEKRADGWCSPLDVAEPASVASEPEPASQAPVGDESEDEPTFGPPGDPTHAKRPAKGKKR